METREQQIARKLVKLNEGGIVVALSKLSEGQVTVVETLANELAKGIQKKRRANGK